MTPQEWLQLVAYTLGPFGAAWVGVKTSLNGMRSDSKETRADVKEIRSMVSDHATRLAVIESKVDA